MSMRLRDSTIRQRPRGGMTLVELTIGMVITALVLGALGALWYAVGEAWGKSSSSQNVVLTGNQAAARLEATLRQAKYICQCKAGSVDGKTTPAAMVFFWKGDTWSNTSDGSVQVGELAVVEHDPVDKRIYIYQALPFDSMSAQQQTQAATVFHWSDLSAASAPSDFKSLSYVKKTVLADAVSGALFNVPTIKSGGKPLLEFTLTVTRSTNTSLVYGSTSLRTPSARPL
jgi:Tfp pilus assembly protein FimT